MSVIAQTDESKARMKNFNDWYKSDKGQKEAYFIPKSSAVCGSEKWVKALHNHSLENGGSINYRWLKNSNCRALRGWAVAKILEVKDIAIHVEYKAPYGNFTLKRWIHSGYLELLSEYKKKLK